MDLVFTDLDGTLLDHDTYAWDAARPALDRLRQKDIPWVIVTSKTRAEVEYWRASLGHRHPFIVENGGAVFVPSGYFPAALPGTVRRDGYDVIELGAPYGVLTRALAQAASSSRCRVRGFGSMTVDEVAALCALPPAQAEMAKQREYDEPFLVLDPARADALAGAIASLGRHCTRGGRFWHILGENDKAAAVRLLTAAFRQAHAPVRTVGLGDGLNDASFLETVDVPILIRSPQAAALQALVPRGTVTERPGPAGWCDAVTVLTGA